MPSRRAARYEAHATRGICAMTVSIVLPDGNSRNLEPREVEAILNRNRRNQHG